MTADRKTGPDPQDWEPHEFPDAADRGGTEGVGAFGGQGKDARRNELPSPGPDDPEREVRAEPLYGRDPEQPPGKPPAASQATAPVETGPMQHEPGTGGPTIDASSDPAGPERDATPMDDTDPAQGSAFGWGGPDENYPPTRGPLDKSS
jgi:hypothetical protein